MDRKKYKLSLLTYEFLTVKILSVIINCLFTPFFMLGCILGLVLVATVIWLFAGDYFWNLLANQQKEVKCTKLQAFVTYVAGSMIYGINSTFQKLFSLLSLQVKLLTKFY